MTKLNSQKKMTKSISPKITFSNLECIEYIVCFVYNVCIVSIVYTVYIVCILYFEYRCKIYAGGCEKDSFK